MARQASRVRHSAFVCCVVVAVVAGCGDDTEPPPDEPADTTAAEPTPDPSDEITALWDDYWTAVVPAENELNTDPAQFDGIMTTEAATVYVGVIQNYLDNNLFRAGEPEIAEPTVEVDGESALVQGCVDHAAWALGSNDGLSVEQVFPPGPQPYIIEAALQPDGGWLVSATDWETTEATITC